MEKETDTETKYHKLATEYSKVRSQAMVLKKALLDEQTKIAELNDLVKKQEQTMRKRDQEIDSLIFRNEQLTKRIVVLQQDLQIHNMTKKSKNKLPELLPHTDMSVLNEELQKKILENAQLFNSISEKDAEICQCKEGIKKIEDTLSAVQKDLTFKDSCHRQVEKKYKKEIEELQKLVTQLAGSASNSIRAADDGNSGENVNFWRNEATRWKTECDMLRSKPESSDKSTDYYESQLSRILENNVMLQSELKTVWAENMALKVRLEHITSEHCRLKNNMDISYEELVTSNKNYKCQLDAMTEHLAAQNEKITSQCDEIEVLTHKLSLKK